MIKDDRNYHQRLQEFCDCFLETDYRKELEAASKGVSGDPGGDPDELALKFLGLIMLYGANEEAKKITLQRSQEGKVVFSVEAWGNYHLSSPGLQMADRVLSVARAMAHIEQDQSKLPFSLGLRNDRMELTLEVDRKGGNETFSVSFPKG